MGVEAGGGGEEEEVFGCEKSNSPEITRQQKNVRNLGGKEVPEKNKLSSGCWINNIADLLENCEHTTWFGGTRNEAILRTQFRGGGWAYCSVRALASQPDLSDSAVGRTHSAAQRLPRCVGARAVVAAPARSVGGQGQCRSAFATCGQWQRPVGTATPVEQAPQELGLHKGDQRARQNGAPALAKLRSHAAQKVDTGLPEKRSSGAISRDQICGHISAPFSAPRVAKAGCPKVDFPLAPL